jgi:hypothetical protein
LAKFKSSVTQCDTLVAEAHKIDAAGAFLFSPISRAQITKAAFLNLFVAWETFLESSLMELMIGQPTISGQQPTRYVAPPHVDGARKILIGVMRFFDFGNHEFFRKIVLSYFDQGYPYEPHFGGIYSDLDTFRVMRNAAAHISSTTQTALDTIAVQITGTPNQNISLYTLLTTVDPRSGTGETIFATSKNKLVLVAELIAQG